MNPTLDSVDKWFGNISTSCIEIIRISWFYKSPKYTCNYMFVAELRDDVVNFP